jgi:hypothetical protein
MRIWIEAHRADRDRRLARRRALHLAWDGTLVPTGSACSRHCRFRIADPVAILGHLAIGAVSRRSETGEGGTASVVPCGQFLREAMVRERVTESEVLAAMRGRGIADSTHVEAVILETDGSFSIVRETARGPHSTLVGVSGADQPR